MSETTVKRLFRAFFYAFLPVFAHAPAAADRLSSESCNRSEFDRLVQISRVTDGDTVLAAGDIPIRLIGLDAPEIDHAEIQHSEAGAVNARAYLQELVSGTEEIGLVFGTEKFDRYDRMLAHLFTADGTNIQALLLVHGHAVPLIVPPNISFADCYHEAASTAIAKQRGLWKRPEYQPIPADSLQGRRRPGYRIITGKVSGISESRSSLWINLEGGLGVRIHRDDLPYFHRFDPAKLVNQEVRVQGRLYRRNGQWRMRIRHPLDIAITRRPEAGDGSE